METTLDAIKVPPSATSIGSIRVVEEDRFPIEVISASLRQQRISAMLTAQSGSEALELLARGARWVSVLMLDLPMQDLDGICSGEDRSIPKLAEFFAKQPGLKILGIFARPVTVGQIVATSTGVHQDQRPCSPLPKVTVAKLRQAPGSEQRLLHFQLKVNSIKRQSLGAVAS